MHSAEKQKLFAAVDDFAGSENTASDRARLLAAIDEYVQAVREECAVIAWSTGMAAYNRYSGMPLDAREVGAKCAAAIRAQASQYDLMDSMF